MFLMASARCVSPSASSSVVGFSVVLATERKWLAAETAHCAALWLIRGDSIGRHRHRPDRHNAFMGEGLPPEKVDALLG
ncbi:hypothetical protein ASG82_22780 [Mycobacterium sp. Soil538]|nr:hypothetical protein ASG82_22780 [Mycobacterium sp. Soil538]